MVDKIPENNLNWLDVTKGKLNPVQNENDGIVPVGGEIKPDLDKGITVERQKSQNKEELQQNTNKNTLRNIKGLIGVTGGGATVGAVIGTIAAPGAGTVVGAVVGGIGGLVMSLFTGCIKDELQDMPEEEPAPGVDEDISQDGPVPEEEIPPNE